MRTFKKINRYLVLLTIVCAAISCTTNKNGIKDFSEIVSFRDTFKYGLIDTSYSDSEFSDTNSIQWHPSAGFRKKVTDSLLQADAQYLCIRKTFSLNPDLAGKIFLLRTSPNVSFV
jgi:hypothetical protein